MKATFPVLARIPIKPEIAGAVDEGTVEYVDSPWMEQAAKAIEDL